MLCQIVQADYLPDMLPNVCKGGLQAPGYFHLLSAPCLSFQIPVAQNHHLRQDQLSKHLVALPLFFDISLQQSDDLQKLLYLLLRKTDTARLSGGAVEKALK